MATIDGIGLAEPSTITKSLAAVPVERNSSITYQEVMVLGSPNSTTALALAEVTGASPASTTVGLVVRQVLGTPLTFAASTVGNTSTQTVLISSAATTPYISAYMVASTETGPIVGGFYVGSTLLWPVVIGASLGVMQQSQQVAQPGYVFRGQADRPVHFVTASSGVTLHVGLTYWNE
ncbi:MAG TPA: hypothetical protein VF178_08300 [Gemmatimonadaceae bacterium]